MRAALYILLWSGGNSWNISISMPLFDGSWASDGENFPSRVLRSHEFRLRREFLFGHEMVETLVDTGACKECRAICSVPDSRSNGAVCACSGIQISVIQPRIELIVF